MATKIDHIGIAVRDLSQELQRYCDVLGLKPEEIEIEVVEEQKARVALLHVGESRIELLESTDPEGPIGRHIEKKGEGIHHLAVGVNDIVGELDRLAAKGFPLIDAKPRIGAGGRKIAFLHPKGLKILMELVE